MGQSPEVEHYQLITTKYMGYINDFRAKLAKLIEQGKDEEAVNFAAESVYDSYRNGMKAVSGVSEEDKRKASRYAKKGKK